MISPDDFQGLPIEDPFNSDPLEKLRSGSEEGPSSDRYDPTSIDGLELVSEGSLPSIEETPVEDLLLVEGSENIDAGRLLEGDRPNKKSDLLTGETPTEEIIEDTLIGSTTRKEIAPVKIQPRTVISYIEIEKTFNSGYFTADPSGLVEIDYLYDGGGYQSELAIFSLENID